MSEASKQAVAPPPRDPSAGVPLLVHADVSRPFYEFIHPITPTMIPLRFPWRVAGSAGALARGGG